MDNIKISRGSNTKMDLSYIYLIPSYYLIIHPSNALIEYLDRVKQLNFRQNQSNEAKIWANFGNQLLHI